MTRLCTRRRPRARTGSPRSGSWRALRPVIPSADGTGALEGRRRGRSDGSGAVLSDAMTAAKAIEAETTVDGICDRLCKSLVFVVGATACSTSRVVGDYIVDATDHALREISLGRRGRIPNLGLPAHRRGAPHGRASCRVVRRRRRRPGRGIHPSRPRDERADDAPDPRSEAGRGALVELYEMRLRRFGEDDIAVAQFLVAQAQRRLELVARSDDPRRRPRVYELPSDAETSPRPRTR